MLKGVTGTIDTVAFVSNASVSSGGTNVAKSAEKQAELLTRKTGKLTEAEIKAGMEKTAEQIKNAAAKVEAKAAEIEFRSFGPATASAKGDIRITKKLIWDKTGIVLHTTESKEVFELIKNGELKVVYADLGPTSFRGEIRGNVMTINKNLSVEEQLRTIVHEGSHYLDVRKGGPLAGKAKVTGFEEIESEIRALMRADEFAKKNNIARDRLPKDKISWWDILDQLEDAKYGPLVPSAAPKDVYDKARQLMIDWATGIWGGEIKMTIQQNVLVQGETITVKLGDLEIILTQPDRLAFSPPAGVRPLQVTYRYSAGGSGVINSPATLANVINKYINPHLDVAVLERIALIVTGLLLGDLHRLAHPDVFPFLVDEYSIPQTSPVLRHEPHSLSWLVCTRRSHPRRVLQINFDWLSGLTETIELVPH
jgi:hypothetical protein